MNVTNNINNEKTTKPREVATSQIISNMVKNIID